MRNQPTPQRTQSRRAAGRTGTAAVELAIVLPLLLLLVFGCIDFGRAAYYSMAVDNAVSCGSHHAATHRFTDYTFETWEQRVREAVVEEMRGVPDFDPRSLHVTVVVEEKTNLAVRVTVAATYPFETVVDWPGLPRSVLLRHRVSVEQYQ